MGVPMVTVQKLRFCDTDMLGHVNNAAYSVLLEAGRVEMGYEAGLLRSGEGFSLVIARLELDYLRELNWPGSVRVETAVHRLGNKSFQVRQRIVSDGEIAAKAHTVLAVMDLATRKAMVLREDWRAALERWLVPEF
jgi:acyl-CoA thioester hydrolase